MNGQIETLVVMVTMYPTLDGICCGLCKKCKKKKHSGDYVVSYCDLSILLSVTMVTFYFSIALEEHGLMQCLLIPTYSSLP